MINNELKAMMAKVNKDFGEGTIVLAKDISTTFRFPSGSLTLDVALGGGWPANQWVEIYGKESQGKTAITLKTIAANQKRDPEFTTMWIAAEHYDREQAEALGVDSEKVIVIPTQDMEFAYQQVIDFASAKVVDCIVIDSYPALTASEEVAKDMDESVMAVGARLTGKFFRKVGGFTRRDIEAGERPFLGIFINQQRDKIGGYAPHGVPQTTPGGNAKNYAFYVRCEVRRDEYIEESIPGQGKVKVGQTIKVLTIKNKSAPPQQSAFIDFYFRNTNALGFLRGEYDVAKEIVIMGILFGLISRGGAIYTYGDRKWKGKDTLLASVREELDLQEALTLDVMNYAKSADIREFDINDAVNDGERKITRASG